MAASRSTPREIKDVAEQQYSELTVGDIIISLNETIIPTSSISLLPEKISAISMHGTIFSGGSDIIHSEPSSAMSSQVKEVSIDEVFDRDCSKMGSAVVLRPHPILREPLTQVLRNVVLKGKASTPFTYFDMRRGDFGSLDEEKQSALEKEIYLEKKRAILSSSLDPSEKESALKSLKDENDAKREEKRKREESKKSAENTPENIGRLELFRAFRVAVRIGSSQAISKTKGVSCGNFVSYVFKAAIIKNFFPTGIPDDLLTDINSIELLRRSEKDKKLDRIDMERFVQFEAMLLKHLSVSALSEINEAFLKELYRPVKKRPLGQFVKSFLENPTLGHTGFLFYHNGMAPSMMSQSFYPEYIRDPAKLSKDKGMKLYAVRAVVNKAETKARHTASIGAGAGAGARAKQSQVGMYREEGARSPSHQERGYPHGRELKPRA